MSRVNRHSEEGEDLEKREKDQLTVYVFQPRLDSVSGSFYRRSRLTKMSRNTGLPEPLTGYVPLAALLKGSRLMQDRPRSDGDIWAPFLPLASSSPYRSITDHSCLKVYHKDPAQAFSHGPRPANGDARVSTEPTQRSSKNDCLVNRSSCRENSL